MNKPGHYPARYWHKIDDNHIQCNLCPRKCILKNEQRGFCYVRQNLNGQLILTTYGYSSGFCIDPVEKKPLNQFYPGSSVLSFGTVGCNLACPFCQNWDLSKSRNDARAREIAYPATIAKAAQQSQCKSVAFTYNEPIIFAEYAIDTAKVCHELGIKTIAVTAGYIEEGAREDFFACMDAANVDLKAFNDAFYKELVSASLPPVLDTLLYLKKETNVWLEITNLIIPHKNDSEEEISAMTQWIAKNLGPDVPLHFSAFHPAYKMQNIERTPPETLFKARKIALKNGMHYVYTGNIYDKEGSSTYCHVCKNLLIERDGYRLGEYHLVEKNKCEYCGTICAGCF